MTITNDGAPNTATLGSAKITLPSGSTHLPNVQVQLPPAGKTWSGSILNGVVSLQAQSTPTDSLAPGEAISVNVTATLTVAGANTWTTDAWEGNDYATGLFAAPASEPVVTVAAGPLDHFTVPNPGTQIAGSSFNVTVGAEDAYGNAASGWTSTNGCVVFSGPFNGPPPSETSPSYPAGGACTHPDASQLSFDASGDATASVTLYRATTAQTVPSTTNLTVTDTGPPPNEAGSSGTFTVNPGSLFRFGWTDQPNSSQTAGVTFDRVEATAYDEWDNIKTDYNPAGAVFSGLGTSPNADAPVYGFSWANGIAVSTTMTDYKAETTSLAVTDGSVSASSSSFTVAPGPLDHFTIGNIVNQVAGTAFTATATAFDQFGNVKTDYAGGATLSGNLSNAPDTTAPIYGAFGSWAAGVASASVTAFAAESARNVTATDGSATGTSNIFTVFPGPLDRFDWTTDQPNASQTAGVAFDSVAVTAYDQWDNVKTNYNPTNAVFSGLDPSGSVRGCTGGVPTPGGASPCLPVYGFTWLNGVASSTGVIDYKAEPNRKLTVTDSVSSAPSTITADSNQFTVGPNEPDLVAYIQHPTLTQVAVAIAPTVTVKVEDAFGNVTPGKPVTMSITPLFNPGGGTLTGGGPFNTDASGVATFSGLSINAVSVGYKLDASVPTAYPPAGTRKATSDAFDVANQVTPCTGSTCTATGITGAVTSTVTASGLGGGGPFASRLGPAASAATGPSRLGVTVAGSIDIPEIPVGICATGSTSFKQYGEGFATTSVKAGGNTPSFKVVAVLDKSVVKTKPGNPGATKWDICLGAKNLRPQPPPLQAGCASPTNSESWMTKDGSCAVLAADGFRWGLVADYPSKVKACPTSSSSSLFPGVLSKMKTGAGDIVITFCVPYPWDEKGGFG